MIDLTKPVFSMDDQKIREYKEFIKNESTDLFQDDHYRVLIEPTSNKHRIEVYFNMLYHDGFELEQAIPFPKGNTNESMILFIFVRNSFDLLAKLNGGESEPIDLTKLMKSE